MSARLEPLPPAKLLSVYPSADAITIRFANESSPLLVGWYDRELACVLGFIPPTLLSDTAYLWCNTFQAANDHPVLFGLWARRLIPYALKRYPLLVGHCNETSMRWLTSLGAKVIECLDGGVFKFEIRA